MVSLMAIHQHVISQGPGKGCGALFSTLFNIPIKSHEILCQQGQDPRSPPPRQGARGQPAQLPTAGAEGPAGALLLGAFPFVFAPYLSQQILVHGSMPEPGCRNY